MRIDWRMMGWLIQKKKKKKKNRSSNVCMAHARIQFTLRQITYFVNRQPFFLFDEKNTNSILFSDDASFARFSFKIDNREHRQPTK